MLFDQDKRRCTVYESRPRCAANIPTARAAATTSSSSSSARHQDDPDFVALT
jgi:hypothetical protein